MDWLSHMEIHHLGFLPFIIFYGWSIYMTWKNWNIQKYSPTIYEIVFVVGSVFLVVAGIMWGLMGSL